MTRMNKDYEEALQKCLERLVITLPSILDMLLVKMNTYFLDQQQEVIRTQANSVQKVVEFVKILRTMQDDAFFAFLTALDELNYRHMANEIRSAAKLYVPVHVPPPPQNSMNTMSLASGPASMIAAPSITTTTTTGESDIFSQKPKMGLATEICGYIAAHWMDIGYCLDFDDDGNQVDTIDSECNGNPKKCCSLMLRTWIQKGKGKEPKTWQTLLDILISLDHKTAHDKVKEHLQREQSQQQQNIQELIKVYQPIEETTADAAMLSMSSTPRTRSPDSLKRFYNNMSVSRDSEALQLQSEHLQLDSSEN